MSDLLYSEVEDDLRASVRDLFTDRAPLKVGSTVRAERVWAWEREWPWEPVLAVPLVRAKESG